MKVFVDCFCGSKPKRGDIMQTNVGDRRERTFMILRAHRSLRMPKGVPRYHVWAERWWEMEADFRMRLFRSAERAGGQQVVMFTRYRAKTKTRVRP